MIDNIKDQDKVIKYLKEEIRDEDILNGYINNTYIRTIINLGVLIGKAILMDKVLPSLQKHSKG